MIALESLTAEDFEQHVGAFFTTPAAEEVVTLTLAAVERAGAARPGATREPFALEFTGAPGLRLPQSIRALTHADWGTVELFLTQIADGREASRFEAIFS